LSIVAPGAKERKCVRDETCFKSCDGLQFELEALGDVRELLLLTSTHSVDRPN
jgi:hypothetical protein